MEAARASRVAVRCVCDRAVCRCASYAAMVLMATFMIHENDSHSVVASERLVERVVERAAQAELVAPTPIPERSRS